jgi:flavin-binding protein dodecin
MSEHDVLDVALHDARRLEEVGLLTEREAQAYAGRVLHNVRRDVLADAVGVSVSRIDSARSAAKERVARARDTVDMIDELEVGSVISPGECDECASPVQEFTIVDKRALCLDCADVELPD